MSRSRRMFIALALALILPAPWAHATSRSRTPAQHTVESRPPAPLQFLTSLWGTLTSLWSKNGCQIDPYGRCAPVNPASGTGGQANPKPNGCEIDPYGVAACSPAPQGVTS